MSYRKDLIELLIKQLGVNKSNIFNDVILSKSGAINIYDDVYFQFVAWNNANAWAWEPLILDNEYEYKQNPAQWITEKMEEAINKCEKYKKDALVVKYLIWKNIIQNSKAANNVVFKLKLNEHEIITALNTYVREEIIAEIWDRVRAISLHRISNNLSPENEEFYDVLEEIEENLFEDLYKKSAYTICKIIINNLINYLPEYKKTLCKICEQFI